MTAPTTGPSDIARKPQSQRPLLPNVSNAQILMNPLAICHLGYALLRRPEVAPVLSLNRKREVDQSHGGQYPPPLGSMLSVQVYRDGSAEGPSVRLHTADNTGISREQALHGAHPTPVFIAKHLRVEVPLRPDHGIGVSLLLCPRERFSPNLPSRS